MRAEYAPVEEPRVRRSARARAIASIGPLTVLAAAIWIVLQPYRLTVLHPRGQGFWWLAVEPQVLVAIVGILFSVVVAPGLLDDLEED
jgi:hypothetical protein